MRVVSLVPSSTETLLELGADVVGCSRFCEQPTIPHVGGTKNPDIDAIIALAPDLVVLDREENRIEDHDALVAAGLGVFVSDVRSVDDAVAVVGRLADAVGVDRPGDRPLVPSARTGGDRRTAFVPIWRRPWMTIARTTYGGSVLAHLGVDLIEVDDPADYPIVELDAVASRSPDLVLVPSEPYEFDAVHVDELRAAFASADIRRVDGQDLFWWGARTAGAVARLARTLDAPRAT